MKYQEGILINYLRAFPLEIERMLEAIQYIIMHGSGGDILDRISKKSFRDTSETYFARIRKETLENNNNLLIVIEALIKWYETWKDSYCTFEEKNSQMYFNNKPTHTWLHCLFTGKMNIYQQLTDNENITISQKEWDNIKSYAYNKEFNTLKNDSKFQNNELIQRLLAIYEKDESLQLKELLFGKRIALFLDKGWSDNVVKDIINKYYLKDLRQFSSLNPNNSIGDFDFAIFLTAKASHAAKYKLESLISRDKIFLVDNVNEKLVMEEFIQQLRRYLN